MTAGAVVLNDKTFNVTGTFNKVDNWAAFPVDEQTGYSLPIVLKGTDGEAIKMETINGSSKVNVFGQTDDPAGTMNLVLAINNTSPVRTFTAYKSAANAAADKDGTIYTIDCSKATFAGAARVRS